MSLVYTFPEAQRFAVFLRKTGSDRAAVAGTVSELKAKGTLAGITTKWKMSAQQLEVIEK